MQDTPGNDAKSAKTLPAGVTHHMLAKALFFEEVKSEKLPPEERRARWKENSKSYIQRASRLVKQLNNLVEKGADDAA